MARICVTKKYIIIKIWKRYNDKNIINIYEDKYSKIF